MEVEIKGNTIIVKLTEEETKKLDSIDFKTKMLRQIYSEAIKAGWGKDK